MFAEASKTNNFRDSPDSKSKSLSLTFFLNKIKEKKLKFLVVFVFPDDRC